ncbi:PREDICTED: probable aminotransferase TAT2 [Lupinus angustifolius]|nr:PREDICTED: probable aminotransferase TAT2 [Lupinus angustifolius]
MAVFSSIVPVITIGSLSKRWFVPGWRFGWIATCDPNGILKQTGILTLIKSYLEISTDPPTIIQAAVPEILKRTKEEFYAENLNIMREGANIFYDRCKEIPCLKCPHKPEGAMSIMVQINISQLEGIIDDVDFCVKLAEEESVLLLPGVSVGLKNWLRISFAVERSALEDGLTRIKAFCLRHAKMS